MFLYNGLFVLLLTTQRQTPNLTRPHYERLAYESDHTDDVGRPREKRSALLGLLKGVASIRGMRARQALLSGAEVVPGDTGRHFVKTGGSEKALRDFLSVQPDEVMVHGMPNLNIISTGMVGDRRIVLQTKALPDGQPKMEIYDLKDRYGAFVDIINYKNY